MGHLPFGLCLWAPGSCVIQHRGSHRQSAVKLNGSCRCNNNSYYLGKTANQKSEMCCKEAFNYKGTVKTFQRAKCPLHLDSALWKALVWAGEEMDFIRLTSGPRVG